MGRFVATVIAGLRQQDGQDLLEYAMLCALIAIVAVSAVQNVGNTIHSVLWQVIAAASF
jgi:Flp pilus assembly pilin Flp